MGNENIGLIGENFKGAFSGEKKLFEKCGTDASFKKIILSDSVIDLKVLSLPVVANNLLLDMIFNSIKRLTTIQPSKEDIDYHIIGKDSNKYEILVIIKHGIINEDLSKSRIFTVFQILENILADKEFPDDASFIVREENASFVYNFRDRIFKKRNIYFENDIDSLRNQYIYYICLYNRDEFDSKGFEKIDDKKINDAIASLKNPVFVKDKNRNNKIMAAVISVFTVILIIAVEIYFLNQGNRNKDMKNEIVKNEKVLSSLKQNKGVSEEEYKKFTELQSRKSHVDVLFRLLYHYGKNNMEIQSLSCEGKRFSVSGVCDSDSLLEKSFRSTGYFKDINFYFSKKDNKINFRIDGETDYED